MRRFCYICEGVRRWAGAAGDLNLVDTGTTGELQFFVPALHLELFEGSRSGGGGLVQGAQERRALKTRGMGKGTHTFYRVTTVNTDSE